MCCIFTCCGWMIDLLQRIWVFFMSCCISTAIACVLITCSMSGVALGYNYSLAEYIDQKETNVSVYIKRGVFDDDVASDMTDWRRKGGPSLRKFDQNDDTKTANEEVPPDQMPPQSGRRLDDSILEQSNENNNFEGSLMKLTLKPPYVSTAVTPYPDDAAMMPVMTNYRSGSLDQLKAIQGVINARKSEAARNPLEKDARRTLDNNANREVHPYLPDMPPSDSPEYRRVMKLLSGPGYDFQRANVEGSLLKATDKPALNPALYAVPNSISQANWEVPKMDPEEYRRIFDPDSRVDVLPTMPRPVTYRTGPLRPSTTKKMAGFSSVAPQKAIKIVEYPSTEKNIHDPNIMEEKIGNEDKFDDRSGSENVLKKDFLQKLPGPKIVGQESNEYYDEELKGLPVRRRRSINNSQDKLRPPAKVRRAMSHELIPGLLTKFKVDNSISNEITLYPSISVSKLHFLDDAVSNTTSTDENEVRNGTNAVESTVNDTHSITESSIGEVLNIIQSMFS